jgi:hypothetical protein
VAPFNAVLATFTKKTRAYSDSTSSTQITRDAAPVASALVRFDNAVLRADWPPAAKADVRAMVRTDAAFRSDLDQIGYTQDWTQLTRDAAAASAAANVVRADSRLAAAEVGGLRTQAPVLLPPSERTPRRTGSSPQAAFR